MEAWKPAPRTYSGLLDDVVYRHRITPEIDEGFFSRVMLRNLFFSGPILLNDGHLVNHPPALAQLLDEDSLLNTMLRSGFVRLLVRQPDAETFAANPERMAARGILSFQRIIERPDWPELKRRLWRWADGYYYAGLMVPWPDYQMQKGFQHLFSRLFSRTLPELGLAPIPGFSLTELRERYEAHRSYENGPRTAVEEVCAAMNREGRFDARYTPQIINIASQCYHYNFALCLSAERQEAVAADTTVGRAFLDILEIEDSMDPAVADMPVLSVPTAFNRKEIFAKLHVFFDPGSAIYRSKLHFLHQLRELFRPGTHTPPELQRRVVKEAATEYRARLVEHFAKHLTPSDWLPRRSALVSFGLGKLVGGVGEGVILAAEIATGRSRATFVHKITRPLFERMISVALDPESGERGIDFSLGSLRPQFASLTVSQAMVRSHAAAVPRAG